MSPVGTIFVPFPPKTGTNMLHPRPHQSLNWSEDAYGHEQEGRDGSENGNHNTDLNVEGRERLGTNELVIVEVGDQRVTAAARPDAPARPSHHPEGQSPGTGGEGQDRGGRRKGKEVQDTPKKLKTRRGKRGDLGGTRKTRRQESVGSSVAADPDNLENRKKTGREAQENQDLSKECNKSRLRGSVRLGQND